MATDLARWSPVSAAAGAGQSHVPGVQVHCLAGTQTRRLQCDAWLAASVASAGLDGNIGRPLSRQVQQRTAPNSPALRQQLKTISILEKVDAFASYSIKNSRHFRCLVWKTKRWLKKQIYAKTRKPYSRVFSIFLPNVIKINPYYFKVSAFSDTMYSLM